MSSLKGSLKDSLKDSEIGGEIENILKLRGFKLVKFSDIENGEYIGKGITKDEKGHWFTKLYTSLYDVIVTRGYTKFSSVDVVVKKNERGKHVKTALYCGK